MLVGGGHLWIALCGATLISNTMATPSPPKPWERAGAAGKCFPLDCRCPSAGLVVVVIAVEAAGLPVIGAVDNALPGEEKREC
jgi:uncharacterized RDD family membrane protein YckC